MKYLPKNLNNLELGLYLNNLGINSDKLEGLKELI